MKRSTGAATVTGPLSQWNNLSSLTVGGFGDGTLNVEAGGAVSNTAGDMVYYERKQTDPYGNTTEEWFGGSQLSGTAHAFTNKDFDPLTGFLSASATKPAPD